MSLSHDTAREYLELAADGLLSAPKTAELQDHLAECARCRRYAARLTQLESHLAQSLQRRWPGPERDGDQIQRTLAKVRRRVEKRQWIRRVYGGVQAVAWAGLVVALVIVVAWLFRTVTPQLATVPAGTPGFTSRPTVGAGPADTPTPTVTPPRVTEVPAPTPAPQADAERTLTICMGAEPSSLYLYGGAMLVADHVREAIYDGPIDSKSFSFQPVILEKLPSLSDGDAITRTVKVQTGDRVLDNDGQPVVLREGTPVRPAGCHNPDCAVLFDGAPLEMEQMVVTFTLKSGITWSDGEPLTAYDSVYSFQLDSDPDTPSPKTLVDRTAGYAAADDLTAVWTGLPGYRDSQYATRFWSPLPEHAWSALTALELLEAPESVRRPLGWGAYVIQEWIPGQHIALTKNERYWRADQGLPKFERVIFRFVGENANANVAALLAGECDVLDQTTQLDSQAGLLLELQSVGQVNATFVTGTVWEHIDFGITPAASYDRPDFFGDVRVRRAIAYCMDRQEVVDTLLYGQSQVPGTYLPPEHPLYDSDAAQYPFDPTAGAALLDQAGWIDDDGDPATPRVAQGVAGVPDGTTLSFTLATTSAEQRQQATQIYQASLAECGIQVELEYWNSGEFFADGPDGPLFGRHFDLAQFAWLTSVEPPCELYLSSQVPGEENGWSGQNNPGFSDAAYDAACNAARRSLPGTPEYEKHHKAAQRIFAEQLPVVPLYLRLKLAAIRPDLTGLVMDPTAESEFWNIEEFDLRE